MRNTAGLITAGCWLAILVGSASARAQSPPAVQPAGPPAALDVPFLPQSALLCGGAAVAMVERWWGRRGVYAEDFASLVRPSAGGIFTTDLVAATSARGWNTQVLHGTPELIRQSLRDSVPVVALIQVAPNQYHYVVVLGWSNGRVVFHDPAGTPHTIMDEAKFLVRWSGADRWALVIRPLPTAVNNAAPQAITPTPFDSMPCRPWLDQAVDAAAASQLEDASRLLEGARLACPTEPLVLRELAGIRFKEGNHAEAIRLVTAYLSEAPDDEHGWQLLATSRYLTGDHDGALVAWNHISRPTVDLVRIDGAPGIRFQTIADALAIAHGTLLTSSILTLAQRRVSDLPALQQADVGYQPLPGGIAEVRVAAVERPVMERAWRLIVGNAVSALAQHEVGVQVASPMMLGELWSGSWRWDAARPRLAFRMDIPAHFGVPGVIGIEGTREHFRFSLDTAPGGVQEDERRSIGVGFGSWLTASLHTAAGLRVERWEGDRDYLALSGEVEFRAQDDRLILAARGEHAAALSRQSSYTRSSANASWSSSLGLSHASWSMRAGGDWAGARAPLGIWPVAGGNVPWAIPLRAQALTSNGVLLAERVGRGILHAGIAGDHPVYQAGPLVFAAGLFLDGADVIDGANHAPAARFYLDGGAGIRVGLANGEMGVFQIDLARSLVGDRRVAVTASVQRRLPRLRVP